MGGDWFHFAVKIHFEGKSGGIKNCAAITAVAQMTLNLAANFGARRPSKYSQIRRIVALQVMLMAVPSVPSSLNMHAMSQNT